MSMRRHGESGATSRRAQSQSSQSPFPQLAVAAAVTVVAAVGPTSQLTSAGSRGPLGRDKGKPGESRRRKASRLTHARAAAIARHAGRAAERIRRTLMLPVRTSPSSRRWIVAGFTFASIALAACAADRIVDVDQSGYSLVAPPNASVLVGATIPLTAKVVRNGTDTLAVGDAVWHSSDTTIAKVVSGPALRAMK